MKAPGRVSPPRLAVSLLRWLAGPAAIDDLSGDLEELFHQDLRDTTPGRARFRFWGRTLSLAYSYALQSRKRARTTHVFSASHFQPSMLASYFRVAFRSLRRDRFFAVTNIFGLAVGMSISLLLLAMLGYVWRYDTFHTNKDHIYRLITHTEGIDGSDDWASSPSAIHDRINGSLSGVKAVVRLQAAEVQAQYETRSIPLQGFYANPSFLDVFTFPLLAGNRHTALAKPDALILTEAAAFKLFGTAEPMGQLIQLNGAPYEVSGVLKNHPRNSHLHFEVIIPYAAWESSHPINGTREDWNEFSGSYQYLLVPDPQATNSILEYLDKLSGQMYTEPGFKASFTLQPLNDIVPGPDLRNGAGPSWDLLSMGIFFFLTLLILLPACANYAMITISRALRRMKEIGIRKTIGSSKGQVIMQFTLEAVIVSFLALALSFYFFVLIRDEFLALLVYGRESLDLSADPVTFLLFSLFALLVGLLSGLVPGLYFARLGPLQALRSKAGGASPKKFSLRKGLLVAQFALTFGFIMSVVIVFNQYRKTLQYNFGFNQANILDVQLQGADPAIVRSEFSKLASVGQLSFSSHIIGTQPPSRTFILATTTDSTGVLRMSVDDFYLDNLGIRLVAGRNFENDPAAARRTIIVNEQFVRQFKLGNAEILSKVFALDGQEVTVTGVVADFHYASLREPIEPLCFVFKPEEFSVANVKLLAADPVEALGDMEQAWKTFGGDQKFISRFLDDEIEEAYSFYFTMIKICGFLGLLAISISCLGLLGMVVFTVQTRVKEIGIRKVMGSTTNGLVVMLSWDFARLMLIAFAIAAPLTYLFMDRIYLPHEHSKIPIGVMDILVSLVILLVIGLTTILSQTVRASRANPVDSLRSE